MIGLAMSGIANLSAKKLGSAPGVDRRRQSLRRLSPDLISKANDDTTAQVTRIGLTFLGTAAFCLLSLFSPDSALFGGSEKINVPLAGPVSFFGFMLLGPAVLIMLRVYLQIYVEHSARLERLRRSILAVRAPTLVPLKNPVIRVLGGLTFYFVLPIAMMLFTWKAAVFPAWGSGLLCVAVGVTASHAMLPLATVSWRSKALLSVIAAIMTGGVILGFGPPRRPFDLFRANLSNQWLQGYDLNRADLRFANLTSAILAGANLSLSNLFDADLSGANLTQADLSGANLGLANLNRANLTLTILDHADLGGANLNGAILDSAILTAAKFDFADLSGARLDHTNLIKAGLDSAKLRGADLSGADLSGADLSGADLSGANLSGANLSGANLSDTCGNENTRLPEGFTVRRCPVERKR
jgi:uncharacterized protein YjbI with pentapeptide repeats